MFPGEESGSSQSWPRRNRNRSISKPTCRRRFEGRWVNISTKLHRYISRIFYLFSHADLLLHIFRIFLIFALAWNVRKVHKLFCRCFSLDLDELIPCRNWLKEGRLDFKNYYIFRILLFSVFREMLGKFTNCSVDFFSFLLTWIN